MSDIINDGLDGHDGDDGRVSLIKGTKLKFTKESQWVTGDDTVVESDREFLVVEIVKASQKWVDDKPIETIILGATEKFPDIEVLNKAAPPEEWREKFGKSIGPWENAYVVYLVDPETWQIFTFPTGSIGGGQAVRDLREATRLARRVRGPGIYPRVCLTDVFMPTKFEGRQRPSFHIIGYESLGPERAVLAADEPKLIEAKPTEPAKPAKTSAKRAPASKPRKADPDFDNAA